MNNKKNNRKKSSNKVHPKKSKKSEVELPYAPQDDMAFEEREQV